MDALAVAAIGAGGLWLARVVRLPMGTLLGPMLLAAAVSLGVTRRHRDIPAPVETLALAGIGLSVGLRFSAPALCMAGRILPAVLSGIAAMIGTCALVGVRESGSHPGGRRFESA